MRDLIVFRAVKSFDEQKRDMKKYYNVVSSEKLHFSFNLRFYVDKYEILYRGDQEFEVVNTNNKNITVNLDRIRMAHPVAFLVKVPLHASKQVLDLVDATELKGNYQTYYFGGNYILFVMQDRNKCVKAVNALIYVSQDSNVEWNVEAFCVSEANKEADVFLDFVHAQPGIAMQNVAATSAPTRSSESLSVGGAPRAKRHRPGSD